MKRWLKRFLLTVYHTVSFVWFAVAIVVVFFWIRSYWIADGVRFVGYPVDDPQSAPDSPSVYQFFEIESRGGQVCVQRHRYRRIESPAPDHTSGYGTLGRWGPWVYQPGVWAGMYDSYATANWADEVSLDDADEQILGFAWIHRNVSEATIPLDVATSRVQFAIWIPYWFITLIIALWPAIWLLLIARNIRNLKRMARGHCGQCNYNLRGDPAADKCPECGAERMGMNVEHRTSNIELRSKKP